MADPLPAAPRPAPAETSRPVLPDPDAAGLTRAVTGRDQTGAEVTIPVIEERPLTIFLNSREIVTAMTIGDHPRWLALGFLRNQGMLRDSDVVTGVDVDAELEVAVVRTARETDHESKLARRTRTSGCAVGTVFGDMMEGLEGLVLPDARVSLAALHALAKEINTAPSLYLAAGAVHGTVLCEGTRVLAYMEDVGRHNAVDKIAGWMLDHGVEPAGKVLYTTGRLTSEMVLKCARMGIPALVSRSGFTAWGVDLARRFDMTLIGRMRGRRFVCLSGERRLVRDVEDAA